MDHLPFTIYQLPPKEKHQAPLTTSTTTMDSFLQPQLDPSKKPKASSHLE